MPDSKLHHGRNSPPLPADPFQVKLRDFEMFLVALVLLAGQSHHAFWQGRPQLGMRPVAIAKQWKIANSFLEQKKNP
jgi:hypothetical protein